MSLETKSVTVTLSAAEFLKIDTALDLLIAAATKRRKLNPADWTAQEDIDTAMEAQAALIEAWSEARAWDEAKQKANQQAPGEVEA